MKPTWIIQKNLVSELHRWISALEENKSKYQMIEIIPFSDDLPTLEIEGPSIVYGSTTMIKNAPKKGYGLFFNPDNFRPSLWRQKYLYDFFNYWDAEVYRIKDLDTYHGGECFMRPNSDLKDFSGSVVDRAGIAKFYTEVMKGDFPFSPETEVFLAPLRDIYKEYRIFIVNGKAVAWSQYRLRSMLLKREEVPKHILDFAEKMANIWSPEKAFVMDVAEDSELTPYVLELNCFNASGVYACNVSNIVRAVEELYG